MSEIILTLKEANELYPALAELAEIPMRGKVAARIGKLFRNIKRELIEYETDRNKVVERLRVLIPPKEDDADKEEHWEIPKDNRDALNKEIEEMLAETFTVPATKIDAVDLEEIAIKPSVIAALDPLIDFSD